MPELRTNGHATKTEILPGGDKARAADPQGGVSRVSRDFLGGTGLVVEAATFLATYVVLPAESLIVIVAWVLAAWLGQKWDRFPHLAVTSPEKRCGKTRLMQLLELLVPNPYNTTNISPAAIYRLIELRQPTLLLDEAQSISRRGSEASEVIRELFNAGIDRNAKVLRVGGEGRDQIQEFRVYSPKVIALIGDLDSVLADRCLPIRMMRKTDADEVAHYRSRVVDPVGRKIGEKLGAWAAQHADEVAKVYDGLEPFALANDRMAELLLPLQAVLTLENPAQLETLEEYAASLDARDKELESMSPGVRLLWACRAIFNQGVRKDNPRCFLETVTLILELAQRTEEPWSTFTRGDAITPEALANLLRPYGIKSERAMKYGKQTQRGYFKFRFVEAWGRYLPTLKNPG
jgi:hypothetical protein